MSAEARRALATIRECVATDRYAITLHFAQRMEQRSLFWPDVLALIDEPAEVRSQGLDEFNRAKWVLSGEAAGGEEIGIVCAIEPDEDGTVFITIYWEE